jgi:mannitol/fructose-specific phosphotransferase system IIA component (Ntr-type)
MILAEIFPSHLALVPLVSTDKYAAIEELVELLSQHGHTHQRDALLGAVLEREFQRSTGIGKGFAVPHAKTDAVKSLVVAMGRTSVPIDFASFDDKPVSVIALLASPICETRLHMQALAALSRMAMNQKAFIGMVEALDGESLHRIAIESANGAA